MMKKIIFAMTSFFCFSILSPSFSTDTNAMDIVEGQTVYSGECGAEGDNVIWTYDTTTQTMTFSGTGAIYPYYRSFAIQKMPEWDLDDLRKIYAAKHVIIEEGITSVGTLPMSVFGRGENEQQYCTLTVPESVTDIDLICFRNRTDITYYGKTGSYLYYLIGADKMISTGVAEHPYIEFSGSSNDIHWSFDYASRVMTIGGSLGESFGNLLAIPTQLKNQVKYVLWEKDLDYPVMITPEGYNAYAYDILSSSLFGEKGCYFYQDSNLARDYEAYLSITGKELQYAHYVDKDRICGDINLDGKVDLIDGIFMNKVTAGIVTLTDLQKMVADCNGDGSVNDADATTLMEFLILQVPSLPYQG